MGGQIVSQVVLQDVGVEAVALLELVVRGVGEHDQDTEVLTNEKREYR